MKILAIDGMNFLHRARSGFTAGDHAVTYNVMRGLRALVEQHAPTRVYFILEGHPQARYDLMPTYKSNRIVEAGTPKHEENKKFFRQVDEIIDLLSLRFPISVVRHPDYECDDTIFNLIKNSSSAAEWIVASTDTDFIQLLNEFPNVKLYNTITKEFVTTPSYDYVVWKSLRGDGSDCIPGIKGIGDKKALEIVNDPDKLIELFDSAEIGEQFARNHQLIKFMSWSGIDAVKMTSSFPTRNWDLVAKSFSDWEFKSLLKEETFKKFCDTFESLWG